MFSTLFKYLALYNKVPIPGVGCFFWEQQPAVMNFGEQIIHAPYPVVRFTTEYEMNNRQFVEFIAREMQVSERDANDRLNDFAVHVKTHVQHDQPVEFPMIGLLKKGLDGILFEPENALQDYYPDVKAERVIREDAEHHILVGDNLRTKTEMQDHFDENTAQPLTSKDYWWVAAIILAIIGISAILYYYYFYER